jgi:diguanylate cyclase (GGDEF)-like protein
MTLLGKPTTGHVVWLAGLVPLPVALVLGGIGFNLVIALEQKSCQVDRLATTDPLTGLSDRRRFMQASQREIDLAHRHRLPLALLSIDIDRLTAVNDAHGQAVGDEVLVEIARRCRRVLRSTDLLARQGGAAFVVLLPNTPSDRAYQLAERLRQAAAMSHVLLVHQQPVWVTVSIGAAGIAPGEAATLDALLLTADEALQHAKDSGRDRVFSAAWTARSAGARA